MQQNKATKSIKALQATLRIGWLVSWLAGWLDGWVLLIYLHWIAFTLLQTTGAEAATTTPNRKCCGAGIVWKLLVQLS